jgi:hypothetical protein
MSGCLSGLVQSVFQSHAIFACKLPRLVHEAEAKAPELHSFKDLRNSCSENSFFKEFLILEPQWMCMLGFDRFGRSEGGGTSI